MFELGPSLREARHRRGVELAQAEVATKIRSKYLRALEDERFELLPSPTYVKGFLRTYAEYLGLEGQLFVDEYSSRFIVDDEAHERRVARRPGSRAAERQNRRFETIGVSFGPDDKSDTRARVKSAFGQFLDVHDKSDAEIATMLRRMEIDIAVDLKGFTQDARPGIFALRPAPLQVNYLGYPGTLGAD